MPSFSKHSPSPGQALGKLNRFAAEVTGGATRSIKRTALVLEKAIKVELSQPGSGRLYPKRRGRGAHRASAPGEPPAADLGDLRRTVGNEVVGGVTRVGSPLKRAARLEFGGASTAANGAVIVIEPRPFMRPALAKAKKDMTDNVVTDLRVQGRRLGD